MSGMEILCILSQMKLLKLKSSSDQVVFELSNGPTAHMFIHDWMIYSLLVLHAIT